MVNEMDLKGRLGLIMNEEKLNRISVSKNGEISVDVHYLGTKEVMVLISNIIALTQSACTVRVIHGYNHGTAIKDMINGRYKNNRIIERRPSLSNKGVTALICRAAV